MKLKVIILFSLYLLFPTSLPSVFFLTAIPAQAQTNTEKNNQALSLYEEGNKLANEGRYQQAIETYQKALVIFKETNERYGQFLIYNQIGLVYRNLSNYAESMAYFQKALIIAQELGDKKGEGWIINNLGNIYLNQSKYDQALKYFQKSLKIRQELGEEGLEIVIILNNIGLAYDYTANYRQAIEYYQQSLRLSQAGQYKLQESITLDNLSVVYNKLGQYALALEYNLKALELLQELGNKIETGIALINRGLIYVNLRQFQKAVNYYEQALAIQREIKNRAGEATTLNNLGLIYDKEGNYSEALKYYQQALAIEKEIGIKAEQGTLLNNIGSVYKNTNQLEKALEYYQQSLQISQEIGNRSAEGIILGNIANIYTQIGNPNQGLELYQKALTISKELGQKATESRTLSNIGAYYLKNQDYPQAEVNFLASISLFESLRPGLKDEYKISLFQLQLADYLGLQKALIEQNKIEAALEVSERSRSRAFAELLASKLTETANIETNIKPPTIAEIKQIAQQQNATIIEYSVIDIVNEQKQVLLEPELYIWVVKPTGEITFRSRKLPLQNQELESFINKIRQLMLRGQTAVNSQEKTSLQQLYELLIEPIKDLLPNDPQDQVIFIPHQSLFLVPFAALQDNEGNYLVDKHTILIAPSIQVLDLTHRHKQQQKSAGEVLIIGNPTMPYVSNSPGEESYQLASLPGAEKEAKTIAQIFNTKPIIGSAATKQTIFQKIEKAGIIHFATHGLLDDLNGLNSSLALAPTAQDNGLLTAEEIIDLNLNSDLVVLSACDTGRGKITGDGVIGLSRSFISAGTSSIMVSLWQVPDLPTAFLMEQFYQNFKKNPNKAQALRQAMLTTKQKYPQPKDWSAFSLMGEAK